MNQVCIDTGILDIYFSKDCTPQVTDLMNSIANGTIRGFIMKEVLCEAFFHLCKNEGKDSANIRISSFTRSIPVEQVNLDDALIVEAGLLKCQHAKYLSYIDCMSIALCLNEKLEFHTTEKKIKQIPQNTLKKLKIVKYKFE